MATQISRQNSLYGFPGPLSNLFPAPLIMNRAPTTSDQAELGQVWVDTSSSTIYQLAALAAGVATWTTAPASGATVLASLQVTPGNLEVSIGNLSVLVGTSTFAGNVTANADLAVGGNTLLTGTLGVTGATTTGDLTVGGNMIVNGDFDLTDTASVSITSTNNAAGAIALLVNGGAAETMTLTSAQGTGAASIGIVSTVGGVTISGGLATADAVNILSTNAAGGVDIDAGTAGITIDSTGAFSIDGAAASNVTTTGAGIDLTLSSVLGSVLVRSTEDAALAIRLHANGGTSETIQLHSDLGTGVGSINLLSDVGGLTFRATGLASADAINLEAVAGGIDADAALQINIASSQAAVADSIRIVASAADGGIDVDAGTGGITIDSTGAISIDGAAASNITTTGAGIDLTLSSVLGSVLIESTEDAANNIRLHSNGGVSDTLQLHADLGTGVASIHLLSDVGGITLAATGLASADAINLEAPAGGVDVDAALQINVASSQAAVDAIRLVSSNAAGGIDVDAGTGGITIDSTGALSLDAAAASNVTVTGAGLDLTLSSVGGSVAIASDEAVASAINLTASNAAGGIQVSAGTNGVAIDAIGGSFVVTAGTGANGSVNLSSTGTGDIILNSDDTMLLDADGVLELNSSAGAINIGNDADAQAINIGSAGVRPIQLGNATAGTTVLLLGPANVGITLQNSIRIMTGAGSPNGVVTAPIGSMWLRTDAGGATERIYVNTNAGTTWTNVTCAA